MVATATAPVITPVLSDNPASAGDVMLAPEHDSEQYHARDKIVQLPVGEIIPFRYQPRRHVDEAYIQELAADIQAHGVEQPILVRPANGQYEIIFGQCRHLASQRAGLPTVPAMVRVMTDLEALETAIRENEKRKNVNPIDTAVSYTNLILLGVKQEEIGARFGHAQGSVSNQIRLLKLPASVQQFLIDERLTTAHGVALLTVLEISGEAERLANLAVENGWSSKKLETETRIVRSDWEARNDSVEPAAAAAEDPQRMRPGDRRADSLCSLHPPVPFAKGSRVTWTDPQTGESLEGVITLLHGKDLRTVQINGTSQTVKLPLAILKLAGSAPAPAPPLPSTPIAKPEPAAAPVAPSPPYKDSKETTVQVKASRFHKGGDIATAYNFGAIVNTQMVPPALENSPFRHEGRLFIAGYVQAEKGLERAHCYELMNAAEYQGQTFNYREKQALQKKGIVNFEAIRIRYQDQDYVLGPSVRFEPEPVKTPAKAKASTTPAPATPAPATPPAPAATPPAPEKPKVPEGLMQTYAPRDDCFFCEDAGVSVPQVFATVRRLIEMGKPLGLSVADLLTTLESTLNGDAEEPVEAPSSATNEAPSEAPQLAMV